MTAEQRTTVLFVLGAASLLFMLSPLWPADRDPLPFLILIGGMLGIPAVVARDRNGHSDEKGTDDE